jgi:hypothetical protein
LIPAWGYFGIGGRPSPARAATTLSSVHASVRALADRATRNERADIFFLQGLDAVLGKHARMAGMLEWRGAYVKYF